MMTKKERAAVDAMAAELAKLQAYLVEIDAPDKDVPVPTSSDKIALGWAVNINVLHGYGSINSAVQPCSSASTSHYVGQHITQRDWNRGPCWSQRGVASYSTRRRALLALRAEVCRQHAATLAKIDAEIEKEPA